MGVLHIQLDGLYAGLEKRRRPHLETRPLLMVMDNKVVDFCGRARARTVKKGVSVSHARNSVPGAAVVGLDVRSYGPELELLARLGSGITPQVEMAAPDRVFLQLAPGEDPETALHGVRRGIPRGCGHRLFAGYGANKLLAQICVYVLEREGAGRDPLPSEDAIEVQFLRVRPDEGGSFLRDLPVSFLWTLPGAVRDRLERLGLNTIGEVAEVDQELLGRYFGPIVGRSVSRNARGEDSAVVNCDYPPPRVVWDRAVECPSSRAARELLVRAAHLLARGLRDRQSGGLDLKLSLLGDDGRWLSRERHFSRPMGRQSSLEAALISLWEKMAKKVEVFSRIRAEVSGLQRERVVQETVFSLENRERRDDVRDLLEDLNRKYSARILFWGEHFPVSYREKRLSFWDPLRRRDDESGTFGGGKDRGLLFW